MRANVREDWHCFDIGANIGYYTLLLSGLVGQSGRVIAVEPAPRFLSRLDANLALNDVRNVKVERVCLSDKVQNLTVFASETTASVFDRNNGPVVEATSVASTTLDAYCDSESISRIDFMKIDVDGHEPFVIRGAERTIARHRPLMTMEIHPHVLAQGKGDPVAMLTFLIGEGYRFSTFDGRVLPDTGTILDEPVRLGVASINIVCRPDPR